MLAISGGVMLAISGGAMLAISGGVMLAVSDGAMLAVSGGAMLAVSGGAMLAIIQPPSPSSRSALDLFMRFWAHVTLDFQSQFVPRDVTVMELMCDAQVCV